MQTRNGDATSLADHKLSNFFTPPSWRQPVITIWSWSSQSGSSLFKLQPWLFGVFFWLTWDLAFLRQTSAHSRTDLTTQGFLGLPATQWKSGTGKTTELKPNSSHLLWDVGATPGQYTTVVTQSSFHWGLSWPPYLQMQPGPHFTCSTLILIYRFIITYFSYCLSATHIGV